MCSQRCKACLCIFAYRYMYFKCWLVSGGPSYITPLSLHIPALTRGNFASRSRGTTRHAQWTKVTLRKAEEVTEGVTTCMRRAHTHTHGEHNTFKCMCVCWCFVQQGNHCVAHRNFCGDISNLNWPMLSQAPSRPTCDAMQKMLDFWTCCALLNYILIITIYSTLLSVEWIEISSNNYIIKKKNIWVQKQANLWDYLSYKVSQKWYSCPSY